MIAEISETTNIDRRLLLGLFIFMSVTTLFGLAFLFRLINSQLERLVSTEAKLKNIEQFMRLPNFFST